MIEVTICRRCGRELAKARLERDFAGICPHCLGGLLAREEKKPTLLSPLTKYDVEHAPLKEGSEFRSFKVLELVARGAMGYVYRAHQVPLNRTVALKILAPELVASDLFRIRFDREARILAALNHPNIVQIFEFGREGDLLFLAMEHVEGDDLQSMFDLDVRPDRMKVLGIVKDVASGLRAIHESGLIHRDIKPANILVTSTGRAKIADFGIAIEADESQRLTETGTFLGTPQYVSPEHIQGRNVDGRSDLYSLGVILYQGLTGRPPFTAPNATALLLKHVHEVPPAMWKTTQGYPPGLGELVRKLLAKNPASRPDSARAVEVELGRIIQESGHWSSMEEETEKPETPISNRATARRTLGSRPPQGTSRRGLLAVLSAAALIIAVALAWIAKRGPGITRETTDLPPSASTVLSSIEPETSNPADPPFPERPIQTPAPAPESAAAQEKPAAGPPEKTEPAPTVMQEHSALSPPERRRRLDYYASIINLAGIAAIYADLRGLTEEAGQLRKTMSETEGQVKSLVALMNQEGQNPFVDDTLRPTDEIKFFENQSLELLGRDKAAALLGTFVAGVKGGSRARIAVQRDASLAEFVIRFDERPKALHSIVQIIGLIPGQEVVVAPALAPPAAPKPDSTVDSGKRSTPPPAEVLPKPANPAPAPAKAPPPAASEVRAAEKQIREICKADYAKKASADRRALAKKLLQHALDSKENGADCYALLSESRELSIQSGDAAGALRAISEQSKRFEFNALVAKSHALGAVAKSASSAEDNTVLANSHLALADEALSEGEIEIAASTAAAGALAARKGKDIPLIAKLDAKSKEAAELKVWTDRFKKAKEALSKNPEDAEANLGMGRYLCLLRGDWVAGLPYLAKGSDSALKLAATKDLAGPADPMEQTVVGDAWWELAAKESGSARETLRQRAGEWYGKVLPQLSGLNRVRIEKRLSETGAKETGELDLLKLIDPKDSVGGQWTIVGQALRSADGAPSRIMIPYEPGDSEYDLTVVIEPKGGSGNFEIGLAHEGRQFMIDLDGSPTRDLSGIHSVDGQSSHSNETTRKGKVFDKPSSTIVCSVRRSGVTVTVDGVKVIDYRGLYARLSLAAGFKVPNPNCLFLSAFKSQVAVTKVTLRQVSGQGKTLR